MGVTSGETITPPQLGIGPLKVPEGMAAGEAIARGWARGE